MSISEYFNLFEGVLWIFLAGIFLKFKVYKKQSDKKVDYIFALFLVLFGISDFIEINSGAWWKPRWLLCWKGINLLVLVALLIKYK